MVMQLYGQELLEVSQSPAKFCGCTHYGIGDIMVLVFHVILTDYVIKESGSSLGRSPLR